jgi:hypothetical protein
MKTIPSDVLPLLDSFTQKGSLAPLFVVSRMTGLSRSRVNYLILTGVFRVHLEFGYQLVEIASVNRWYLRRLALQSKRSSADRTLLKPHRQLIAKSKI